MCEDDEEEFDGIDGVGDAEVDNGDEDEEDDEKEFDGIGSVGDAEVDNGGEDEEFDECDVDEFMSVLFFMPPLACPVFL